MKPASFFKIYLIIFITVIISIGAIGTVFYFQIQRKRIAPQPSIVQPPSLQPPPAAELVLAKDLIRPEDISFEKVDVVPNIPPYTLPLEIKDISNWQKFSEKIQLSQTALSLLKKNGFVVIQTPQDIAESESSPKDDFVAYYKRLKDKDLPIFITADSLLHYYHIFFATALMRLERDIFYSDIWEISKEFFDDAVLQYKNTTADLKEAAKRNVAYLSVALELLKPKKNQVMTDEALKEEYCKDIPSWMTCEEILMKLKEQFGERISFKYFSESEFRKYSFEPPEFVKDLVQKEIELIEKHEGWKFSPIFIYKEDYSQYVPRGHYTKSEKLKNYFKALMWYGRMTSLIKGSEKIPVGKSVRKIQEEGNIISALDGLISTYDAKIQTIQSSLLARKFSQSKLIQQKWQRIYTITSFFVGFSDDLGPYEYSQILKELFKEDPTPQKIEEKYPEIKNLLLNLPYNPKIYSGLDEVHLVAPCPPFSDEESQKLKIQAQMILENTKGFRLMGQRFTIDSWLFSEIVSPYSGEYIGKKSYQPFTWIKAIIEGCPEVKEVRGFPRGLDIFALLGSKRAKEILKELGDTDYSDYEKKFTELKEVIDSFSTKDWLKNVYNNWLYVLKFLSNTTFGQGYQTFMQTQAWQDKNLTTALASWAQLRHDTILYVKQSYTMAEIGGGGELPPPVVGYVEPIPEFYVRLLNLTNLTNKGLKNLLSPEELEKLKVGTALDRFSEILTKLLEISKKELENKPLTKEEYYFIENFGTHSENLIKFVAGGEIDPEIFKTVMVADVHTESNTQEVLEEGVGYIKTLIVAYKLPQGHILVGVGPVFSYYEFKQPMKKRLTDEAWRKMLETEPPPEPEWVKSFSE